MWTERSDSFENVTTPLFAKLSDRAATQAFNVQLGVSCSSVVRSAPNGVIEVHRSAGCAVFELEIEHPPPV
jgi:hypothetical protein